MDAIVSDFSFCICLAYFLNALNASLFCTRKKVQVYLEKSSTITKAYTLPPKLLVLDGPNKSICNNCSGLVVDTTFLDLKVDFVCFPFWQASQSLSLTNFILGNPITRSCLISLFKCSM